MGQFADLARQGLQSQLSFNPNIGIDAEGADRVSALGAAGMGLIAGKGAADVPTPPPIGQITTTFDKDGNPTHTYKDISDQAHQFMQGLLADGQRARQSYGEAIDRVHALRTAMEDHPIIATLGRIASAYAANVQAPTSAGHFARAAAEAAYPILQHNPLELAGEEAKLSTGALGAQQHIVQALDTQARIAELQQYHEQREEDRKRFRVDRAIQRFDLLAKGNALTPEGLDARIAGDPDINSLPQEQKDAIKQAALDAQTGYRIQRAQEQDIRMENFKNQKDYAAAIAEQHASLLDRDRKLNLIAQANIANDRMLAEKMGGIEQRRIKLADDYAQSIGVYQSVIDMLGEKGGKPIPPAILKQKFIEYSEKQIAAGTMTREEQRKWLATLNDADGKINAYVTGYPKLTEQSIGYSRMMSKEGQAMLGAPTPLQGGLAPALNPSAATSGTAPAAAPAAPTQKRYIRTGMRGNQRVGMLPDGTIEVIK